MFWGLRWSQESWLWSTWCNLETQPHGSGLQLLCWVQGRQVGGLSLQSGLLCWCCCPMALAGRQAPLRLCRIKAFLWMALFPGPSLSHPSHPLVSCETPTLPLTWSQETLGELSRWRCGFSSCRESSSSCSPPGAVDWVLCPARVTAPFMLSSCFRPAKMLL